jgi:hypothetical protein
MPNARPLISVIIPTHDRPGLLADALRSVAAQVGTGAAFAVETVVVDDASRQPAAPVARAFGATALRLDRNRGPSAARNAGLAVSRGQYVAFLDDDDRLLPHHLSTLLGLLHDRPEVGVAYGRVAFEGSAPWPGPDAPSGDVFAALLGSELVCTHAALVRRSTLDGVGAFDEALPTMEHYDLFVRLARRTRFAFHPDIVAESRFSRQGLWFSSIARGEYERAVLGIIERALAPLPSDQRAALGRRARTGWFPHLAYWTGQAGGAERQAEFVLRWLRECPWLLAEPEARATWHAARTGAALAAGAAAPLAAVGAFAAGVRSAVAGQPALQRRRVLGYIWLKAARALADSPVTRSVVARAALRAVRAYPPLARRPAVVSLLVWPVRPGAGRRRAADLGLR